jgi:hypothetical protein
MTHCQRLIDRLAEAVTELESYGITPDYWPGDSLEVIVSQLECRVLAIRNAAIAQGIAQVVSA